MQMDGFVEVSEILRSGVYLLVAKGKVIYVGKSKAMIARINAHRKVWIDKRRAKESWIADTLGIPGLMFDEIHIRPCPPHLLDSLEEEMINLFKPRYNIQLKTNQKVASQINLSIGGIAVTLNAPTPTIARRI